MAVGSAPTPQVVTDRIAVRTEGLSKRYGSRVALRDWTLEIPRGEVFGLLGPNGAGKTTAVRLLLGLTKATEGEGWILGEPLGSLSARRRIGYVPELFRHPVWLTGEEILRAHSELAGVRTGARSAEIARVLDEVGLAGRERDRVDGYSKGMQQRLAIGVALLGRPELLILDEPTSALDPVGRRDVRELIRRCRARGATVLLNSHLLSEVELLCDRIAVMRSGQVLASGPMEGFRGRAVVRIRVAGDPGPTRRALAPLGSVEGEGDWIEVADRTEEDVPDLVRAAVLAGGRILAVETRQGSLEDRLLELLGAGAP